MTTSVPAFIAVMVVFVGSVTVPVETAAVMPTNKPRTKVNVTVLPLLGALATPYPNNITAVPIVVKLPLMAMLVGVTEAIVELAARVEADAE